MTAMKNQTGLIIDKKRKWEFFEGFFDDDRNGLEMTWI